MNSTIFVSIVISFLVLTNIVAYWRSGSGKLTFGQYSADPGYHGSLAIFLSVVATIVGGGMFFSVATIGFDAGLTGGVIGVAYILGLFLFGMFAQSLRNIMTRFNVTTLSELLTKIYSRRVAVLFDLSSAIMYFFLLAGQFIAMYEFARFIQGFTSFAIIPWILLGLAGISMFLYPLIGGLRKDISTDVMQVLIICVGSIIVLFAFLSDGLSSTMWATLPPDYLTGFGRSDKGYGWPFTVGVIVFVPGLFLVRNDLWQRVTAAKNPESLKMVFCLAGVVSFAFYLGFSIVGMWGQAAGVSDGATVTLEMIRRSIGNPYLLGVVVASFFSAVMSSADTFINNTSVLVAQMYSACIGQQESQSQDRRLLLISRLAAVILTGLGAAAAWSLQDLVNVMVGGFSALLMFLPAILGVFVARWRSEMAAFYSVIVGISLFLFLFTAWNPKMAFAPAAVVSFVLYFLISKLEHSRRSQSVGLPSEQDAD